MPPFCVYFVCSAVWCNCAKNLLFHEIPDFTIATHIYGPTDRRTPLLSYDKDSVAGLASLISCLAEWQHNFTCSPCGEGITVNKMNQNLNGSISFSAVCLDCLFLYSWAHSYLLAAVSQNARSAKLYEVIS